MRKRPVFSFYVKTTSSDHIFKLFSVTIPELAAQVGFKFYGPLGKQLMVQNIEDMEEMHGVRACIVNSIDNTIVFVAKQCTL
jgi:hypothetical protein